jgi:hypothetical protein
MTKDFTGVERMPRGLRVHRLHRSLWQLLASCFGQVGGHVGLVEAMDDESLVVRFAIQERQQAVNAARCAVCIRFPIGPNDEDSARSHLPRHVPQQPQGVRICLVQIIQDQCHWCFRRNRHEQLRNRDIQPQPLLFRRQTP